MAKTYVHELILLSPCPACHGRRPKKKEKCILRNVHFEQYNL
jgi:hypothetical protein